MMKNAVWTISCLGLMLLSCNDSTAEAPTKPSTNVKTTPTVSDEKAKAGPNPHVVMDTSMGAITIELNRAKAPITVDNFLKYTDDGFYNGTIFHRVMDNFMIQGGGFEPGMTQKKTRKPIQNEAKNGLKNKRGTIAMARTPNPHSASAQFFINVKDNAPLDYPSRDGWGYCVFGKVTTGMDVVDKIKKVATTKKGPHANVPVEDVIIKSVKRK
jgi:cyclophilin family peptidyl-prolyl cis-trans isomerase